MTVSVIQMITLNACCNGQTGELTMGIKQREGYDEMRGSDERTAVGLSAVDSLVITRLDPLPGHDHRMVKLNGEVIGFSPLDSDEIRLTHCPKCNRENYALAVLDGICAWCGWDATDLE